MYSSDCVYSLFNETNELQYCISSSELLDQIDVFNSTNCIRDIYAYSKNLSYICLFYYFYFFPEDQSAATCIEFEYLGIDHFESMRCRSLGDHIVDILELKDLQQINNVLSLVLASVLFLFWLRRATFGLEKSR